MNKGFSFYIKKSFALLRYVRSKHSISSRLSLNFYLVISFLGKLFLFTRPLFLIADANMAKMITDVHGFSLLKAFENANGKGKYWNLLLSCLVIDAMMAGCYCLTGLPALLIFQNHADTLGLIFLIVSLAFDFGFLVYLMVSFSPMGYLAAQNGDFDVSDYLYNAFASTKGNKTGLLWSGVLELVMVAVVVFGLFVLPLILTGAVGQKNLISTLLCILAVLCFLALAFFVFAPLAWFFQLAHFLLFADCAKTKKTIVVKPLAGTKPQYEALFDDQKKEGLALSFTDEKEDR